MKKLFSILASACLLIVSCSKEPSEPVVHVTGVSVSPTPVEIEVGQQTALTATITPSDATNKNIVFTSSKESVATVSQDGIIEAVAVGDAIVTATTEDGNYKAHCNVKVVAKVIHVTGIALNKTSLSMEEGDKFTLVPTITPSDATNKAVNWSSDNEAIVSVSAEGVVTALKAGKATVTATTVDQSKTATCAVDVTEGIGAVTGEASHISCRNAKISGKANLPGTTSADLSFGVLYSTSSGVIIGTATQIQATKPDADYNFTIDTKVLEPETTYYYRSYITQSGEVTYGETKSFKTIAVSSMIRTEDATDINPKDAVLNADLDLTDCNHTSIEYGFDITLEGGSMRKVRSYNYADNKFSCKDELLTRDKQYYFVAYVTLDGRTYRGEAKSFTTASVQASVTAEASNVSYSTATISGKLTVTSEGSFAKSAILYCSTTANTLDALKSSGTKQTISLESDGTYSVIAKGLASNAKNYYCVIAKVDDKEFATSVNNFTTKSLPEGAVDLGLSILWHKQNIGASSPEQYGRYFAWGDVTGQTWDGSKWSGGGFSTYPTYELDANNNLKPEYDAAHVNLGGSWRMPTKAEQQELINNCTRTWTSNYNGTGVAGIIFISTKPGYEGNSIFLPAAGYGWNSDLFYAGSGGYWSSTFSSGDEAWCLVFFSGNVYTSDDYRLDGRPVRPVSE